MMKSCTNLYNLPNILRVKKLRRIIWTEHIACMGQMKKHTIKKRQYITYFNCSAQNSPIQYSLNWNRCFSKSEHYL
jgi:hypothetical protein